VLLGLEPVRRLQHVLLPPAEIQKQYGKRVSYAVSANKKKRNTLVQLRTDLF
jgi:hypothetical protein